MGKPYVIERGYLWKQYRGVAYPLLAVDRPTQVLDRSTSGPTDILVGARTLGSLVPNFVPSTATSLDLISIFSSHRSHGARVAGVDRHRARCGDGVPRAGAHPYFESHLLFIGSARLRDRVARSKG